MSIWSAIGAGLGYASGVPGMAAIGASVGGGIDRNAAAQESAQQAQAFSASQYASRYQTQVKDMEAAGLNPMLAYTQSPGASPQGVTYQPTNIAERVASDYSSAYNVEREGERIEADTRLKDAQTDAQESMSKLTDAQREVAIESAAKIKQETVNLKSDVERIKALTANLIEEKQVIMKTGWNLTDQGNVLRATVDKLRAEIPYLSSKGVLAEAQKLLTDAETRLKGFDVASAERSDNFGRDAQQYRILLDIAKLILGRR